MQAYKNLDGDSPINAYETGADFIRIRFKDGGVYLYTNAVTGVSNVNRMKLLAANGHGLCSFINKNVRKAYARKES